MRAFKINKIFMFGYVTLLVFAWGCGSAVLKINTLPLYKIKTKCVIGPGMPRAVPVQT